MPTTPAPVPPPRTHRTRPVTAALAACLAALALAAGCSAHTGTTPTTTPTPTTPAATTSPTPTLSPEDAAARATALAMEPPAPYTPEFTPDGAAEATTYFIELYPYVYATGDLDAWERMSEDDCIFCNSVINNVTELHNTGGWADPWGQETTRLEWWIDQEDPNRYVVRSQVVSEAHTAHSEDGARSDVETSDEVLLVQLYWTGNNWNIEAVEVEGGDDSE